MIYFNKPVDIPVVEIQSDLNIIKALFPRVNQFVPDAHYCEHPDKQISLQTRLTEATL